MSWVATAVRVGTVQAESTNALSRVIDQGEGWFFRFHRQGRVGGELRADRPQLEDGGWRLRVPASVASDLRAPRALSPP